MVDIEAVIPTMTVQQTLESLSARVHLLFRRLFTVVILMLADLACLFGALFLAVALRFDSYSLRDVGVYLLHHRYSLLPALLGYLVIFYGCRLYRSAWRFASLEAFYSVLIANVLGVAWLVVTQYIVEFTMLPRAVIGLFAFISTALTGGLRVSLRVMHRRMKRLPDTPPVWRVDRPAKRAVILGGGSDGARLLSALREDILHPYTIIGFLDDRAVVQGVYIRDVRVIGPLSHLFTLLEEGGVDEVLVALPNSGDSIREYVL
ncbi:MAG TPA: hypothetical protein VGL77_00010, partial [Armatimonadota bacterium]